MSDGEFVNLSKRESTVDEDFQGVPSCWQADTDKRREVYFNQKSNNLEWSSLT